MPPLKRVALSMTLISLILLAGCDTTPDQIATPTPADAPTPPAAAAKPAPTPSPSATTPEPAITPSPSPATTPDTTPDAAPSPQPAPTMPIDGTPPPVHAGGAMSIDLQVGQWFWRDSPAGGLELFGEVWNHGDADVEDLQILINVHHSNGSVAVSGHATAHTCWLPAGQMTPFRAYLLDAPSPLGDIRFVLDARPAGEDPLFRRYGQFDARDVRWLRATHGNHIRGEIRNTGDLAARLVLVVVAGYDGDGRLIMVEWTFADREVIHPGKTSPFAIFLIPESIPRTTELRVFVEGAVAD